MRFSVRAAAVAAVALLAVAGCGSTTAGSHPKATAKASMSASAKAHHARRHHARHVAVSPSKPAHTAAAPAPVRTGCYPLSNSGTCYEPGEFCRHADAGVHGVAGDGKQIVCENKDGLRWEPV